MHGTIEIRWFAQAISRNAPKKSFWKSLLSSKCTINKYCKGGEDKFPNQSSVLED
jgi:hypothetical protein